jgi:transketolase
MKHIPGIDMSSGSLGQGVSVAAGMAAAGKYDKKDYRVYALAGDGEIQEGQIWEAAMWAGHKKLDNLVVIVDNNNLQIDGSIEDVCSPYPIDKKFEAFNFHTIVIDGHNFDEIRAALEAVPFKADRPTCIIAKTVKCKGIDYLENTVRSHYNFVPDDKIEEVIAKIKEGK